MSKSNPWIYIPTLYFAEGLPYTIVAMMSSIYFKNLGASNVLIGHLTALSLPWTLKFIWAPLVDFYGTKKTWLVTSQFILTLVLFCMAGSTFLPNTLEVGIFLLTLIALVSSVNDTSIDAIYLELLNKDEQALFVGVRNTAYRLSMLFGNGAMVYLAGLLSVNYGNALAWCSAFVIMGMSMLVCASVHFCYLPKNILSADIDSKQIFLANAGNNDGNDANSSVGDTESKSGMISNKQSKARISEYLEAIFSYFEQPGALAISLYILTFRLGDAMLLKQASNFLLDPLSAGGMGISVKDVGIIYGTVGVSCLLLGGIIGGYAVSKGGIKFWLWPSAIIQNSAILLYYFLALLHPPIYYVYIVNSLEQFAYGFGTAAYTVFMLGTVKQEFKAAHYAVATAMMACGLLIPGYFSGDLYAALGYSNFFLVSFLLSLPGIICIAFLPIWQSKTNN